MTTARGGRPPSFRFSLRALLAAPAAIALLIALGRWMCDQQDDLGLARSAPGSLPTVSALLLALLALAMMAARAHWRGRLRELLLSRDSPAWYGGAAIPVGFLPTRRRLPAGGRALYEFVTWSLSPSFLPQQVSRTWPMAFGAVVAIAAFSTAISRTSSSYRLRWASTGAFLAAVCLSMLVLVARWGWRIYRGTATFLAAAALIPSSIALASGRFRGDRRKVHLVDLIGVLFLIPSLDPVPVVDTRLDPLGVALFQAGPGYWLEALGAALILVGTLYQLRSPGDGTPIAREATPA